MNKYTKWDDEQVISPNDLTLMSLGLTISIAALQSSRWLQFRYFFLIRKLQARKRLVEDLIKWLDEGKPKEYRRIGVRYDGHIG